MISAAKVAALLAGTFALICIGLAALQVRATVAQLPATVHLEAEATREMANRQIGAALHIAQHQINEARLGADRHIGELRRDLVGEVRATRADALVAIDRLAYRTEVAVGEVRTDLSSQLTTANETIARETARLNASVAVVAELAAPLTVSARRLQEVIEIGTDCEASPRCWQNTLYDMNVASQKSSTAFAELTLQTQGIATDLHRWTTAVTAPTPWWKKLLWTGGELTMRGLTR